MDVGKERHHVCIRDISSGNYYRPFSVTNDRDGFTELVSSLERLAGDKDDFVIGVESCPYVDSQGK